MSSNAWQPAFKTIKERGKHMWKNPVLSDVEFLVCTSAGVKISIPAHRYVLAVSSPVFEAMFHGAMAESSRKVSLTDCTAEALSEMLRYAYFDEVELTGSNVMSVMYLAEKYILPGLNEKCTQFLQENLEAKDVLFVLPEIMKIQDENLQRHCWKLVDETTEEVVMSDAFLSVTRELLCDILDRDELMIEELELFKAVDRWAEQQTSSEGLGVDGESKRNVLGEEAIRRLRFPLISQEQFVKHVLPKDILNREEIVDLFAHYVLPKEKGSVLFRATSRGLKIRGVSSSVTRFTSVSHTPSYRTYNEHSICFEVNTEIELSAVTLFGSLGNTYKVSLKIERDGQPVYKQKNRNFSSTHITMLGHDCPGFVVTFDYPVLIEPYSTHILRAWIDGPDTCSGQKGLSVVINGDVEFNFMDSPDRFWNSGAEGGQFPVFHYIY